VILLLKRLAPALQAFAIAAFIDRALAMLEGSSWRLLALPMALLGLLVAYGHVSGVLSNLTKQYIGSRLKCIFAPAIMAKCESLPFSCIEDSEISDLLKRVGGKPDETMLKGFLTVIELMGIGLQAAAFLAILAKIAGWAAVSILAISIPVAVIGMIGGKPKAAEPWTRKFETTKGFERKVPEKWILRLKATSSSISVAAYLAAGALLIPLSKGEMSSGLYISIVLMSASLVDALSWELSDRINDFSNQIEYIKDLDKLANMEEVTQ
jgi:hypothetical protein